VGNRRSWCVYLHQGAMSVVSGTNEDLDDMRDRVMR